MLRLSAGTIWKTAAVLFFALFLIVEADSQRNSPRSVLDRQIDAAFPDARVRGRSPDFGGSMLLLKSKLEIPEYVAQMQTRGLDSDRHYIMGTENDENAFAIAPGMDQAQHFVNAYLVGFAPFETDNIFGPAYTLSRTKTYQLDRNSITGFRELWQTSREAFFYKRGDCEDHAIALADWLIEMGEDARVVAGEFDGEGHAWVILFKEGKQYLFEATDKRPGMRRLSLASMHPKYQPRWMFNREHFWFNTGSARTVKYHGPKWQKKSRYSKQPLGSRLGGKIDHAA
ncbi:MAG: transglutaminase-like domain-containing protein [Gammaproteobacteria bacterium]|nr:transglutaminase-like domain-containing protein [Gammaproteobacteria bacterium]